MELNIVKLKINVICGSHELKSESILNNIIVVEGEDRILGNRCTRVKHNNFFFFFVILFSIF